jgi:hypothetical protein
MAMIELVDFNEIYNNNKQSASTSKAKTTRRSRGAKKSEAVKGKSADTSSIEEAKSE